MTKLLPKIKVNQLYQCAPNSLAILKVNSASVSVITWDTCRESFAYRFNRSKEYKGDTKSFVFQAAHPNKVRDFIRQFEKTLGLKGRTIIRDTTIKGCLYIRPTKFWLTDQVRMGLFTILLRCGSNYDGVESFDLTINSYKYGEETKFAINRFLQGHTTIVVPKGVDTTTSPWRNLFAGRDGAMNAIEYLKK